MDVSQIQLEDGRKNSVSEIRKAPNKKIQTFIWISPRSLAIIYFIILFLWIFRAEGGLGAVEANLFGWHALLMSLFVVFFTQEAVLSFSSPIISFSQKGCLNGARIFHVICHVLGIISAMLGIVAIVYYKKLSPQPPVFPFYSVYSPHSWLGIAILILWGVQLATKLYVYVVDVSEEDRTNLLKLHRYLGKVIYVAGLATCALGLQDMQSSDLASSTPVISGTYDTLNMGDSEMIVIGNTTINVTGYFPNSPEAQYSCACTILLLLIGMATFGTVVF